MASTSETSQLLLESSSPLLPPRKYEVFLSFRGEDTRRSFTDHLFAALCQVQVHTFRDAEEVHKGEDISKELINAINESMISIVIFSKTYAFSSWCLRELEEILKCKKRVNQVVLPVFYDVDPSEVRKQTGGYGDALTLHQQRFGDKQVNQWKDDLKEVADFSGWDLKNDADGYESKLIDKIVERVLQLVNRTYLNVAKHPVGIHARVRGILSLLQCESNGGVRVIGIYGMGGVGKTTLAKAVFNQIYGTFEGSCFLADVRSECLDGNSAGLKRLQKLLLCKTLNTERFDIDLVDEGINLIKLRLGLKKLLIVVDDVDSEDQLEALIGERDWFGSGSTVIITTRHVNLLNGPGKDYEKYKVEVLSSEESLQLFSLHAFNNPNPSEAFVELSNMIVSYVGGLPLALTVLGSHFRSRSSIQEWRDDFEKLNRIPHDDILKILKISYKSLDDDTRRIFLDIACVYTGGHFNKEEIVMVLNSCGFHAQSGISVLKDKCLLTERDEFFYMHGLVRDMGRAIVYKESLYPEKRSRLFLYDEVLDVLLNNKGTEEIETMTVDVPMDVHLSTKVFSKMTRLRVLKLLSMEVSGSLKYLSNELRLLYWENCSLRRMPTDCRPKKLVILKMVESSIVEFQPKLQNFICLKVLCLERCEELKRAPNFTRAHSLKKLIMWRCSNLVKISQSIGDLKNLIELDVGFCENLRALPSSICRLKSLKVLIMEGCSKIKELPKKFGELEQLRELIAGGTSVSHLPLSCGSLRYLNYLVLGPNANQTYKDELTESFSSSDDNLYPLRTLVAPYHYLQHPDLQIDWFPLLSILDLSGSNFNTLPFNLSHLSLLEDLYLNDCQNLRMLPELPPCLLFLDARNCPLLEKLPDLSDLKLKGLDLSYCSSLIELLGLENLKSINSIDIRNCSALNINTWFVNFFKARARRPNLSMWVSKDMVRENLCSNKVFGSSSIYTVPAFLEEKLRLFVWIPCWCTVRCVLKYKTTGVELLSDLWRGDYEEAADDVMKLSLTEYAYFTQPIKVEEVEVSMVLYPLKPVREEKLTIHSYIYYEEKDGDEVYFFPLKPNVEINLPLVRATPQTPSDASHSRMAFMILRCLRRGRTYQFGPDGTCKILKD